MKTKCGLFFLILVGMAYHVKASVIFQSNLDSYSIGNLTADTTWTSVTNSSANYLYSQVVADSSNIFSSSTSNHYLMLSDQSNATASGYAYVTGGTFSSSTTIGTISFDMYQPTVAGAQGTGFILRIGQSSASNSTTAFALVFNNSSLYLATGSGVTQSTYLGGYSLNTVWSISIVFNNSSSSITYSGYTLASQYADVWINDSLITTFACTGNVTVDTALTGFNFTEKATGSTSTDFVGTTYLDNITVYDVAMIPEPSVAVLLGVGLAACVLLIHLRVCYHET